MDFIGLIPSFGNFFYSVAAFVVALSVIVAVHEYGHYIVGRWSGIHADVFSLGFGPVLFSRIDRRGTRWQVAALPFGGYVKFAGDADASSVAAAPVESLSAEERRRTMAGAPLWARAATVAAGPGFNFVFSILVFTVVMMFRGVASEPLTVAEVAPLPYAEQQVQAGDVLLEIDGRATPPLEDLESFIKDLPMQAEMPYTVLRDGAEMVVQGPHPYPPLVNGVTLQSAAMDAGLEVGDVITKVDGEPIFAFDQLPAKVAAAGGGSLTLEIWRPGADGQGETREVVLSPRRMDLPRAEGGFETRWLIGISGGLFFTPQTQTPGPFAAIGSAAAQTLYIMESSISGLYHMAVGAISSCGLQGPIGIAQTSGAAASQGGLTFVWFIAVLSTAVGLLNLFPIPVLDGGHLVFHAFEAVTGRPPSDGALRVLMFIGIALLGSLMVFALTNDLFCP
ncbi:RIP metalloprotease RseP [Oceaniglobus roseus]|uniref:RIP metalloprotease RseP n=1 Tax=Oceaniglobus roseus TaxID=1737570 RepID=UPI000C7EB382|nr:RIP metalloprotease RseP [Kandeliimicrobium roseum]